MPAWSPAPCEARLVQELVEDVLGHDELGAPQVEARPRQGRH